MAQTSGREIEMKRCQKITFAPMIETSGTLRSHPNADPACKNRICAGIGSARAIRGTAHRDSPGHNRSYRAKRSHLQWPTVANNGSNYHNAAFHRCGMPYADGADHAPAPPNCPYHSSELQRRPGDCLSTRETQIDYCGDCAWAWGPQRAMGETHYTPRYAKCSSAAHS